MQFSCQGVGEKNLTGEKDGRGKFTDYWRKGLSQKKDVTLHEPIGGFAGALSPTVCCAIE